MKRFFKPLTRRRILFFYLLLLLLSYGWRALTAQPHAPRDPAQKIHTLIGDRSIEIAYWDIPAANPSSPTLLLLHGSPGNARSMLPLAEPLRKKYRLLIPDLPGFGGSTRALSDYSIRTHGTQMSEWLQQIDAGPVHAVGYSMGGGVALEIAARDPNTLHSLTLISSIGVQELELLRNYTLNHALHSLQWSMLWLADKSFPHFGALDDALINLSYARNFLDSDQRPLRGILEKIEHPILLIHGRSDWLVPSAAAQEHHRIVPQSELHTLTGGHLEIFLRPEKVAPPLEDFIERVEDGTAATRADASTARLQESKEPYAATPVAGKTLLLFMLLLALATFISEDLACISAGILASQSVIGFEWATLACTIGIVVGDILLYFAGRILGRKALRRAPWKWFLDDDRIERSAHFFDRYGAILILTTRFLPGTRLPTYFAAGMLGTSLRYFLFYFLLAALLWTPLLVGLSMLAGHSLLQWMERYESYAPWMLLGLIASIWLIIHGVAPLLSHRGRRLWRSRWMRWTHWEFWPRWAFYPPIVLYVIYLGLRHRCLTLFTAANPSFPGGGIVMESKSEILALYDGDPTWIACSHIISKQQSVEEKESDLMHWMNKNGLHFPIVLKPDIGERGQGVAIIENREQAQNYFERCPFAIIAQEYIIGEELGVFYLRHPGEPSGQIFSLTHKVPLSVRGDGKRSLEELILDDPRAVSMAPFFFRQFRHHLAEVLPEGSNKVLAPLGTHCRGALFLDASPYRTPQLERAIENIAQHWRGFYFGRFDIRAPSLDSFREGTALKVIELNGVLSEATHIYDPRFPLHRAYATLGEQWRHAFAIGAANAQKGFAPWRFREMVHLLKSYWQRDTFEA